MVERRSRVIPVITFVAGMLNSLLATCIGVESSSWIA